MSSFTTENFTFLDFIEMDEGMSRKVWACRNHPEIRKWMVNQEMIPLENHIKFINGLKNNGNSRYYAVVQDRNFVGSVNIHIEREGTAERGIYIHPEYWGKGLAKKICKDFYSYLRRNEGINTINTKVLKDNVGSNALEYSLGASKSYEDEGLNYYNCDLRHY